MEQFHTKKKKQNKKDKYKTKNIFFLILHDIINKIKQNIFMFANILTTKNKRNE